MLKKPIILPEGYPFIIGSILLAVLLLYFDMVKLAVVTLLIFSVVRGEIIKFLKVKILLFRLQTEQLSMYLKMWKKTCTWGLHAIKLQYSYPYSMCIVTGRL